MKSKKIIILSLLLIIFSSFLVSADPPFQEVRSVGQTEYIIEFPKLNYVYLDHDFVLNAHVLYSNGTHTKQIMNKSDVICEFNGHNRFGEQTVKANMTNVINDPFVYTLTIPAIYINGTGPIYYVIHCSDSDMVTGLLSNPAEIVNLVEEDRELFIDIKTSSGKFTFGALIIISLVLLATGYLAYSGYGLVVTGILLLFSGLSFIVGFFVFLLGFMLSFFASKK